MQTKMNGCILENKILKDIYCFKKIMMWIFAVL